MWIRKREEKIFCAETQSGKDQNAKKIKNGFAK